MALTKADLAERLFTKFGISKRDAKMIVEAFFEEIRLALETGDQVKLSGFGNFDLRVKNQRPGRSNLSPLCGDFPSGAEIKKPG